MYTHSTLPEVRWCSGVLQSKAFGSGRIVTGRASLQPAMVASVNFGREPGAGERILILRAEWLERILSGEKTLEIRGARLREGDVWLGCRSNVLGKARLGPAVAIRTKEDWVALRPRHLVANAALPYKSTWGLPLQAVVRFRDAVPFKHRRGAIGIVKYSPP